eukprot:2722482-Prymnesium_polylepis.1
MRAVFGLLVSSLAAAAATAAAVAVDAFDFEACEARMAKMLEDAEKRWSTRVDELSAELRALRADTIGTWNSHRGFCDFTGSAADATGDWP